jgi:hypothetical protein
VIVIIHIEFFSRALSKRAAYPNNPIVIVIHFYIIYYPTCFYSCQLDINPTLRSTLYGIELSTFVFTNVPIYKNGIFYKFTSRIGCIRVAYVSMISKTISSKEYYDFSFRLF